MIRFYYFLILLLASSLCSAQNANEKIVWNKDSPLKWNDFKGIPLQSNPYAANTNSGMSYTWNYSTKTGTPALEHQVYSNFYPQLSWVKEIQNKDYLLAHEQLHFDISELHARKLRKALNEYEISRNVRRDLQKIYEAIEAKRVLMQKQFDKETKHSKISEEELRWRNYVAIELKKLESYSR